MGLVKGYSRQILFTGTLTYVGVRLMALSGVSLQELVDWCNGRGYRWGCSAWIGARPLAGAGPRAVKGRATELHPWEAEAAVAWIRVDDHFDEHPKFAKAGPLGIALWLAGLAYSNRNLTDGFIPWAKARGLLNWEYLDPEVTEKGSTIWTISAASGMTCEPVDCEMVIELLLAAGLWDPDDGGYHVHDFEKYQPSSEEIKAKRQATKTRVGRWRDQNGNADRNANCNAVTNAAVTPLPKPNPVPVPTVALSSLSPSLPLDMSTSLSNSGAPQAETPVSPKRRKKVATRFDYPPNLEAFWQVFPVKSGKYPAFLRWKELGAETDELLCAKIMAGAKAYAAHVVANPDQSVKHAQGWLTDMRWEDEYGPVTLVGSDPYAEAAKRGIAEKERRMHEKAI